MSFVSVFSRILSGRGVGFCQWPFLYLLRRSCIIFPSLCLHNGLYLLIYVCWTIPVSLGWSLLNHGNDIFDVFLDLVVIYFIEYFCFCVHKGNWSVILFHFWLFVWFGSQDSCDLLKWLKQCSFCFSFVK